MSRARIEKYMWGTVAALLVAAPALAVDLKLGGYVKLDAMWTNKVIDGSNIVRLSGGPSSTPIDDDSANHDTFQMGAYESRFNLSGTEEIDGVKLKGFIEGDFYGASGAFRLRHAYATATLGSGLSVLAGQSWSNFMDTELGPPETIDFNGPAGQLFARTPQLRLTYDVPAAKTTVSVAIENNGTDQDLPYFTGKAVFAPGPVTLEGMGVVTRNRLINGSHADSTLAWGLGADASVKAGPVTLTGHVQRLAGTNSLGNGDFADAGVAGQNDDSIENVQSTGAFAGATLTLGTTVFNAVYGWEKADDATEGLLGSGTTKRMDTFHVNVLQPLWKKMKVGLEYQWAKRQEFDNDSGNYSRVQAGFWYYL